MFHMVSVADSVRMTTQTETETETVSSASPFCLMLETTALLNGPRLDTLQ